MVDRSWNNEVVRWKLGLAYWAFRVSWDCRIGLIVSLDSRIGPRCFWAFGCARMWSKKGGLSTSFLFDHLLEQVLDPNQIFRCRYPYF